MENCTSMKTPMAPSSKLDYDPNGKAVDLKTYIGTIGFLMYLKASGSDIMFSTCLCAMYQAKPKESHLVIVTTNLVLWYC